MARESRGARGRLAFFVLCLAVGVAAVVAVAGLAAGVEHGLRAEARQLLAADLVVASSRPLPAAVEELLATRPGLALAHIEELTTVVAVAPSPRRSATSQLVELKAVAGDYPFYGELKLDPPGRLDAVLGAEGAAVAPDLLTRLGVTLGDELKIGGLPFTIVATVAAEPDRIAAAFAIGPRVFVSLAGLARTELERFGSRIDHRLLVRLPPGAGTEDARRLADELRAAIGRPVVPVRVETFAEAQPALRQGVERVERFLGLVALLSLLVGGVGIAQTVRAWLASRLDAIAVLRCLGMRPREVTALYLGQSALLGLAGSLLGTALGVAVLTVAPRLVGDLLPTGLPSAFQPLAILRGLGLGLGVALLFSLSPLAALARVPPARVLRRDAEPLPPNRATQVASALALALGVWGTASLQAGSLLRGTQFTAGMAAAFALLAGAALAIVAVVRRLPRARGPLWLRYGLAALARPGAATVGAIVALGLGVLVVLGMSLVERRLAGELDRELPASSPSAFLVDIQPAQWPDVQALLEQQGASEIDSVPVVSARLTAIDGRSTREMAEAADAGKEEGGRRWAMTREQRLTYLDRLPADNKLVAGTLWSDPQRLEVSVEEEFARDLGVGLGSVLRFEVQGVPLELTVTSLRQVEWRTFGINFFLVVEPAALASAPQFRIAAARLPRGGEQRVQDALAARFPNVTLLRIRDILEKVAAILGRLGLGVRLLGGFTVVTGIVILAGAVSAGAVRRSREVALLKALGLTRRDVVAVYATEYTLVGLVAGLVGTAGGALLAWTVLTRGMELGFDPSPLHLAWSLLLTVLVSVAAGLGASWQALRRRPVEVLRRAL